MWFSTKSHFDKWRPILDSISRNKCNDDLENQFQAQKKLVKCRLFISVNHQRRQWLGNSNLILLKVLVMFVLPSNLNSPQFGQNFAKKFKPLLKSTIFILRTAMVDWGGSDVFSAFLEVKMPVILSLNPNDKLWWRRVAWFISLLGLGHFSSPSIMRTTTKARVKRHEGEWENGWEETREIEFRCKV